MRIRRAAIVVVVGIVGFACAVLAAGELLTRAVPSKVGAPPADLRADSITIETMSGPPISGWLAPGRPGDGAVLLLHPVRASRLAMLARARLLHRLGYTVLLVDLQAHGESPGDHITFGAREAAGVRASLDLLRRRFPSDRVGVIGVSLGAASLVLAHPSMPADAVVLESMYPTIDEAVADRLGLHLGAWAAPLAPVLLLPLPWRLGITTDELRPIAAIPDLRAPVLIASGTIDRHTTAAETRRLFDAARAPKQLWMVDGAAHVDLYDFDPPAYEARVLPFLATYLRPSSAPR